MKPEIIDCSKQNWFRDLRKKLKQGKEIDLENFDMAQHRICTSLALLPSLEFATNSKRNSFFRKKSNGM
jgi:hypothetical protein